VSKKQGESSEGRCPPKLAAQRGRDTGEEKLRVKAKREGEKCWAATADVRQADLSHLQVMKEGARDGEGGASVCK